MYDDGRDDFNSAEMILKLKTIKYILNPSEDIKLVSIKNERIEYVVPKESPEEVERRNQLHEAWKNIYMY